LEIGKFPEAIAKNRWEVVEITAMYDKAIIIEYRAICYSR